MTENKPHKCVQPAHVWRWRSSGQEDSVVFGPLPHGTDDVFNLRIPRVSEKCQNLFKCLPEAQTESAEKQLKIQLKKRVLAVYFRLRHTNWQKAGEEDGTLNLLGLLVCQDELKDADTCPPFALPVIGTGVQFLQSIKGFGCVVELTHLKSRRSVIRTPSQALSRQTLNTRVVS